MRAALWPMNSTRPSNDHALDHHPLQGMWQHTVRAVHERKTAQSVAAAFGVNERSAFRWLANFVKGGQSAFLAKSISRHASRLSTEELSWIANAVRDHDTQQPKFEFDLGPLSLIRHLIKCKVVKKFSVSSVHRLMTILFFSAQKPLYQERQQDAGRGRTLEAETYPAIRTEAKRAGATIYIDDEPGICTDYHNGSTWAPQGQTPVVQATGRRLSLNMISAFSTQGEFRYMLHEGSVGAKVFVEFLRRLMVNSEKPVFLIVDGHPIHKKKMVKSYIEQAQAFLPAAVLAASEPG